MKNLRTVFIALGVILISLTLSAQSSENDLTSNTLDGAWAEYNADGKISNFFQIEGDIIIKATSDDEGHLVTFESTRNSDLDKPFIKKSYQMGNNAVYIWSSTSYKYGWSETQTYHFSFVGEDILIVHWKRLVNNNDLGEECYSDDGECFTDESRSTYKRYVEL